MKFSIKEIAEGFINDALPNIMVDASLLELASKRKLQCDSCSLNVNNVCTKHKEEEVVTSFFYNKTKENRFIGQKFSGCGCYLDKKQKSRSSQCPIGRWALIQS